MLFFLPAPIKATDAKQVSALTMNPLLMLDPQPRSIPVFIINKRRVCRISLNGISRALIAIQQREDIVPGLIADVTLESLCDRYDTNAKNLKKMKCYTNGSWRRMYLTQPPCAVKWSMESGMMRAGTIERAVKCGDLWDQDTCSYMEPLTLEEYVKQHSPRAQVWW